MYTYLLINLATLIFPLIFSFEKKMRFISQWKFLFPALLVTAFIFIGWDVLFTYWKVWSFNNKFVTGFYIFNLPFEECLFFVTVPFACVFIYEVVRFYLKKDYLKNVTLPISWLVILLLAGLVFTHLGQLYTSVSSLVACSFIIWNQFLFRKWWLGYFWLTYLVCLVPFFIVNGILTSLPVVVYNNEFNLGLRVFSIPVEDFIYQFDLMMMLIAIYEKGKVLQRMRSLNLVQQ